VNLGWRGNGVPEGSAQTFDAGGTLVNVARTRPGDTWDHSLVFGASIPLPLFSRNRGRLVEAEHLAAKASHELRAARSQAFSFVAAVHAEIEAAHAEVVELRDVVLPAAERAYTATLIGFEAGKFPFLDTLDAQRTLFNVESQHIDALANYHRGIAELERLIGAPISAGWDRAGGRSP
jgi:cobalt-zinc-cadmium efflux system outer membrane protein